MADGTIERSHRCRWWLLVFVIFGVVLVVTLCNLSYISPHVAPGIYPQPDTSFIGRRTQVRLPAENAEVAVIFIGGFGDVVTANFRGVYEGMPILPIEGRQLRACYAWDGAQGHLLRHDTELLQQDIKAFLAINPGADLVFVGHSYGGSAVMDVMRHLQGAPYGNVLVVTLDPVSCRERSYPKQRSAGVSYWVNAYCSPYRSPMDLAARVGGPWRECEQADVNLCFSGKAKDEQGQSYRHSRPQSLFADTHAAQGVSAQQLLFDACKRLSIGKIKHSDSPENESKK